MTRGSTMTTDQQTGPEGQGPMSPGVARGNTLHYFPFSLYSIIVRVAIEFGRDLSPETSPDVKLRLVNLQENEHLTEEYLILNAKGQVPALDVGSNVLTESLDILKWLGKAQPQLLPEAHKEDIETLLEAFYAFHAQPLAVKPDTLSWGIPNKAQELLENPEISETHRRCLEIKSVFHDTVYGGSLIPDNVQDAKLKARLFIQGIAELLQREQRGNGEFIFGEKPTVLDAVATTFLARLQDMEHEEFLRDPEVCVYHLAMIRTEAWQRTTHGRQTIWQEDYGPAEKWLPL